MSFFDLTGKTALITGSTKGIGKAIASAYAAAGARVVISSRNQDSCDAVAAEIVAQGGQAIGIAANISDRAQLEEAFRKIRSHWGPLDIVVANAATNPYFGPLAAIEDRVIEKLLRNNIQSVLWLCNLARTDMLEHGGGSIVVVSSIRGLFGSSTIGAYGITKAADMSLVRNLAVEWGSDNIRVNSIAPGLIRTDFARALWEDDERRIAREQQTPLQRLGDPDDIVGVALMLASRAGAFMTGQVLVVDGGVSVNV